MRLLALRGKLKRKRKKRPYRKPELTIKQILAWADFWHERIGNWPTHNSGRIPGSLGENWSAIDSALYQGLRGLAGGSSLFRLLAEHRGVRNRIFSPKLTEEQILTWADAH